MPGTTRYSATFDRTYEEEDRVNPPNSTNARRSRSQSWQANSGHDGRPYTPFGSRLPAQRSSSTDNGSAKGAEHIPTRTAKTDVKAHNNPFQFVKVGTCPLYKKAEEQLKKVKEVKKTDILKEEEEEWQSNLDSWKSRRRKMSEDVFRRQEEIKQLELEEKIAQANQKKTKTFSEMVESRATRGRALSLCLVSSPLEFQNWEYENKTHKNGSCSFTDESGENSTVNSEDEGVIIRGRLGKFSQSESEINLRTNGDAHIGQNSSKLQAQNGDYNKLSDDVQMKPKENQYIDSGLESISSSHRAGDTPDSGSDFSQDSNSSIDCDSPRTGVNVLEEFNSKASQMSQGHEVTVNLNLTEKGQDFGFTFLGGKDEGQVLIASVLEGSKADSSGIHLGDRIITVDGSDVSSKKHIEIAAVLQKARERGQIKMVLWRHTASSECTNGFSSTKENSTKPNNTTDSGIKSYEKSVESENEMYVDDFEELQRQSELLASSQKSETTCSNDEEQTKENLSSSSIKDVLPLKTSLVLDLKENISNGITEGTNKNQQKVISEVNSENQKKNIVKVKRVRRKGVCALNAGPNEIPQQGISVSSLFPLSPVTELPSPSEETKTISSSLTSNNNIDTSNSENSSSAKGKVNDAAPQLNSPVVQENEKNLTTTVSLTASSKLAIPPAESKPIDKIVSKAPEKLEAKPEQENVPSSPTTVNNKEKKVDLLEGPQNEKPKPPKKLKLKVKKGSASEKNSSPKVIEPSNSPVADMPAKEKTQIGSKSPLIDKLVKNANEVENELTSKTGDADVTLVNANSVLPATEITAKENKLPVTSITHPCYISNESVKMNMKIGNKNVSPSRKTKQSKVSVSTPESDKPKPILKEAKSKSKEKDKLPTENTIVNSGPVPTENKNLDIPSSHSKNEKSSATADVKKESSSVLTPSMNAKPPKTPESEKAKPALQKSKESEKQEGSKKEQISESSLVAKSISVPSVSNTSGSSKNTAKENASKEEQKSTVSQNKPSNIVSKNGKIPSLPMENDFSPTGITSSAPNVCKKLVSAKGEICATSASQDKTKKLSLKVDGKKEFVDSSPPVKTPQTPTTPQSGNSNPVFSQKKQNTKRKNANSQNTNFPAKQNEELVNANDSLNVVFQSQPKNVYSNSQHSSVNHSENSCNVNTLPTNLVPDVLPVEKVAEEMEKLILEQLEEEERAKELSSMLQRKGVASPDHLFTAPPRLAEPPKEKPPPPPSVSEGNQKESSLKRVNSTKRIKKEIHKRRSNFLGIDSVDESIASGEPSIPPPPALEEILKAEMELDRQSLLKIETAADERLSLEEKEIMQKEKEIIESLESEERQKQLISGIEDCQNVAPNTPEDVSEENRIESLKSERRRIETERQLSEEKQQIQILEEKQLREREEFLKKQEAVTPAESFSDTSLSVAENVTNALKKPELSTSLPMEIQSNTLLLGSNGDGKSFSSNACEISENKTDDEKKKASQKPAVPPKPLKKKEALRKERERLRQEQEALQREREEHRRKLMLEQEELMKHQKSHAPDVPVPRLGPLPPIVQPTFPPQLTTTPRARENASFPSRSHHGAPNGAVGSMNTVELMGPPVVRQNRLPASRKAVQNEPWGQQKMPSVRKQNHDSLTESRYNQNHWLIQEAEMRRIAELKERQQRTTMQLLPSSQTHLAEDDVCSSNPPRVPVIPPPPTHNPHLNYAVQEKMWNYAQPANMPLKKYPPPVVKEPPLHTIYPPRETVSQQPPTKPSRVVPMERQEQMLSVSGRKRCSHCNEELGRGAAMIIESLHLYYHIHCFQCCVCQAQLGNGSCGTDVRVRNNKLHCHSCYSNDEAGLKFSQV